jgi:peptidoglycan DL-endopeptidase CwlO
VRVPPAHVPHSRRGPVAVILAIVVGILMPIAVATPAQAKPSVAEIEKQIDAANNKLEPIVEDYNRVHSQLATNRAKVTALEAKLQPLQLQASTALARLQPMVIQAYEGGPTSALTVLVSGGATAGLVDRMNLYEQIARTRRAQIASVLTLRDKYHATKDTLDAAVATLQAQNADLAAKKATIDKQIAALQKLRQQIYGSGGGPIGSLRPVPCPFTYIGGAAGIAVKTACAQIGKRYVWAADGPNTFDCSGLTLYAWGKAGKTLRHYTRWQWEDTNPVSRANLRPGDLVFFYPPSLHHVGMYVGGGWMVHAPHTGDYVRMARIDTYPIAGYRRP